MVKLAIILFQLCSEPRVSEYFFSTGSLVYACVYLCECKEVQAASW